MNSPKSKVAILSGLLITAVIVLVSYNQLIAKSRSEMFKELHGQMQNFKSTEVVPMLNKWKNQIDAAMSKEDLAKLNELRSRASEFHSKMVQERRRCINEANAGECDGSGPKGKKGRKHSHGAKKGMNDEMRTIITELKPLSLKYLSTLDEINPEFTQKKKEWKEITSEIFANWKESNKEDLKALKNSENGKGFKRGNKGMRMMEMGRQNGRQPYFIMLWNGEEKEIDEGFFGPEGMTSVNTLREDMTSIKNYPNPFSESTSIEFYLPDGQMTKLSVVDESGKVIKVIHDGFLNEGNHKYDFNPKSENLNPGVYIYQLECDDFSKSGKMIFNK